jgi:hypothetical protein
MSMHDVGCTCMHKSGSKNWSGKIMLIKKIQGRGCHWRGRHVSKREEGLVKNDMSRKNDAV